MRRKKIILPNEKILSLLEERIMAGEAVRLPVRGYSMSPWLLDGRDTVILHPVDPAGIVVGWKLQPLTFRWIMVVNMCRSLILAKMGSLTHLESYPAVAWMII
ncbi:MAG: hypothetical protein PHD89_08850, partial [Bacteroidales bacterium]|nr:hypothetical protein [Bacteroidales bacterium]